MLNYNDDVEAVNGLAEAYRKLRHEISKVIVGQEDIKVIKNIIPFRREGSFYCLSHTDEGFVNGTWAKGATTAKNEKRFVTQMQQGKINYKNDGFEQVMDKLTVQNTEENPYNLQNTILINVITHGPQ